MINDRVDVAIAAGADGGPYRSGGLAGSHGEAPAGGHGKILGVSCKTVQQARRAEAEGADYIGSGAGMPLLLTCLVMREQHHRLRPHLGALTAAPDCFGCVHLTPHLSTRTHRPLLRLAKCAAPSMTMAISMFFSML